MSPGSQGSCQSAFDTPMSVNVQPGQLLKVVREINFSEDLKKTIGKHLDFTYKYLFGSIYLQWCNFGSFAKYDDGYNALRQTKIELIAMINAKIVKSNTKQNYM